MEEGLIPQFILEDNILGYLPVDESMYVFMNIDFL